MTLSPPAGYPPFLNVSLPCVTDADCNGEGTCDGGKCSCTNGFSGEFCNTAPASVGKCFSQGNLCLTGTDVKTGWNNPALTGPSESLLAPAAARRSAPRLAVSLSESARVRASSQSRCVDNRDALPLPPSLFLRMRDPILGACTSGHVSKQHTPLCHPFFSLAMPLSGRIQPASVCGRGCPALLGGPSHRRWSPAPRG